MECVKSIENLLQNLSKHKLTTHRLCAKILISNKTRYNSLNFFNISLYKLQTVMNVDSTPNKITAISFKSYSLKNIKILRLSWFFHTHVFYTNFLFFFFTYYECKGVIRQWRASNIYILISSTLMWHKNL